MTATDLFLAFPWTIVREDDEYDGERSVELRIEELPGFVVAAETEDEAEAMFWPALRVFLQSYVDDREVPPLPERLRVIVVGREGEVEPGPAELVEKAAASLPHAYRSTHVERAQLATA
jgi:predicted RNase H-like HicB family nuclease